MKRLAIALPIFLMLSACNISAAKSISECEELYEQAVNNQSLTTPVEQAEFLEKEGQTCMEFDKFNVWLGLLYQEAGQYDKSVSLAKKALPIANEFKPNLFQLIAEAELQTGSETEAERQAVEIAESYKNYAPIQYFLYGIATKEQDWAKALPYAENANRIEKSALSYLSLAPVLHQLDRHQETVDAVYKALELEPNRIAKTSGILEGIASLAILNRK